MKRITSAQMAEIYFTRLHFSAVKIVADWVKNQDRGSPSWLYWKEVLEAIKAKLPARPSRLTQKLDSINLH